MSTGSDETGHAYENCLQAPRWHNLSMCAESLQTKLNVQLKPWQHESWSEGPSPPLVALEDNSASIINPNLRFNYQVQLSQSWLKVYGHWPLCRSCITLTGGACWYYLHFMPEQAEITQPHVSYSWLSSVQNTKLHFLLLWDFFGSCHELTGSLFTGPIFN